MCFTNNARVVRLGIVFPIHHLGIHFSHYNIYIFIIHLVTDSDAAAAAAKHNNITYRYGYMFSYIVCTASRCSLYELHKSTIYAAGIFTSKPRYHGHWWPTRPAV